jgi:uncharacterized protein
LRAESFFLPAPGGERYCIHHPPAAALRGTLLYLHPFAEEMNKSRRMAAEAARAFAAKGWAVLQIDLHGCGDSSGDFGDASWQAWQDDALLAAQWLRDRYGRFDLLWGLRLGALLAGAIAPRLDAADLLLWQPVLSGSQQLAQFLRLRTAGEMLDPGAPRESGKTLKEKLRQGETIEIAGYDLPPRLALPLDEAALKIPAQARKTFYFELVHDHDAGLTPAAKQFVEQSRAAGCDVSAQRVTGPPFWQTVEITEVPALIEASVAALESLRDAKRHGFN